MYASLLEKMFLETSKSDLNNRKLKDLVTSSITLIFSIIPLTHLVYYDISRIWTGIRADSDALST